MDQPLCTDRLDPRKAPGPRKKGPGAGLTLALSPTTKGPSCSETTGMNRCKGQSLKMGWKESRPLHGQWHTDCPGKERARQMREPWTAPPGTWERKPPLAKTGPLLGAVATWQAVSRPSEVKRQLRNLLRPHWASGGRGDRKVHPSLGSAAPRSEPTCRRRVTDQMLTPELSGPAAYVLSG